MAASLGFTIADSEIERLIKAKLGFDAIVDLGPAGGYMFATELMVEAGVKPEQLRAAAMNGIRYFLALQQPALARKMREAVLRP